MAAPVLPRYPVYVPSKGRSDACQTARFLLRDGVPFSLVVEPHERRRYAEAFPAAALLELPWDNRGLVAARNWIKAHATEAGHARHWQLDDNILNLIRRWRGKRIPCRAGLALRCAEDFVDRYDNIAVAGLNYDFLYPTRRKYPPYWLNVHVYSCTLVLNALPYGWRLRYNDDTDLCLRVLADGWCTVLINAFLAKKLRTMTVPGGNTTDLYQGDGRLRMARSLERLWPGVVATKRRFQRPQHVITRTWRQFDQPLRLKPGVDLAVLPAVDEYGMALRQLRPVKSAELRQLPRPGEA